ncbi:hypothetical protein [Sphingobacterium paucimobilis]|nr:hypothetical protein [Sphingobacterium paucimobilis]
MDMNKYKRDYKFRSDEGTDSGKSMKWLIIIGGLVVVALAYFIG